MLEKPKSCLFSPKMNNFTQFTIEMIYLGHSVIRYVHSKFQVNPLNICQDMLEKPKSCLFPPKMNNFTQFTIEMIYLGHSVITQGLTKFQVNLLNIFQNMLKKTKRGFFPKKMNNFTQFTMNMIYLGHFVIRQVHNPYQMMFIRRKGSPSGKVPKMSHGDCFFVMFSVIIIVFVTWILESTS